MIDKYSSAEFYAPSIRELSNAHRNSKGVLNLILAALGVGLAGHSAKTLFEDMYESKLSNEMRPSVDLQRKLRLSKDRVDNEFLYNTEDEKHPFTAEERAELERLAEAKAKHESKEAMYKQALDVPMNLEVGTTSKEAPSDIKQNILDKIFLNRQTGKFKGAPVSLDINKVLGSKDKQLAEKLHYDPSTLETTSKWVKNISNPLAKMGPQSAIPLAIVAGGGLAAAPLLAKALVKGIRDKVLPKPKRESKFLDAAKQVYEDAARELQEVGYKKEKDDNKNKKEASVKVAKKGGPEVSAQNVEGNPLLNVSNLPTGALAALLALAAYKGVKGFGKGMDKAKNDLSHKTQFLRGWKAMNKLREYNYNPLTAELEEEPGLKTRTMREKDKRVRELLEDLKDSDEIEYNPIKIQRLTSDYMDLR